MPTGYLRIDTKITKSGIECDEHGQSMHKVLLTYLAFINLQFTISKPALFTMNFEKALALYRNDKTLQILRAEHYPLLVSFFHLAFKQQERIAYPQSDLAGLLGDFLFSLERCACL